LRVCPWIPRLLLYSFYALPPGRRPALRVSIVRNVVLNASELGPRRGHLCRSVLLVLAAVIAPIACPGNARAAEPSFQVIVHPEVRGTQIPRAVLSSIFLKDVVRWGDGLPIAPVDQSMRSEIRASFSQVVLETPVEGVASLWHSKMIKGVMPPPVKSSDEDVIAYVAETKGAIGYVSAGTVLPETVKLIRIID
jgi:hypothetical protein